MLIFPSRDENSALAGAERAGARARPYPREPGESGRVWDSPFGTGHVWGQPGQNWDWQSEVSVYTLRDVGCRSGS